MIAALFLLCAAAAAAPPRLLYDQRQEGEWNVHADLKNIVVLVIPTATSSPAPGLADFLLRALPFKSRKKTKVDEETLHFIESKTAPYHVDISQLAKLRPEVPAEEVVIAKSPAIALVKDRTRAARAFVLTVPSGEDEEKKKKKKAKEPPKSGLKVIGVEHDEDCGPGVYRDADGICRVIQN